MTLFFIWQMNKVIEGEEKPSLALDDDNLSNSFYASVRSGHTQTFFFFFLKKRTHCIEYSKKKTNVQIKDVCY